MIMEIGVKPPSQLLLTHECKHLRTKRQRLKVEKQEMRDEQRKDVCVSGMAACLECRLDWVGTEKTMDKDCGLTATWAQGS